MQRLALLDPTRTGRQAEDLENKHQAVFTLTSVLPAIIRSRSRPGSLKECRQAVAQKIQIERIGIWWCNLMHDAPRWPIHGKYECGACGRHYPVLWEQQTHSGHEFSRKKVRH
jgi:hypothetical protein